MKQHIERWILSNGLVCLYQRSPGVPLAAGSLFLRSGSRLETPAEAGLSSLTMDLLLQGTVRHNARTLADTLESIGGALGFEGAEDYSHADFVVPAAFIHRTLNLLLETLSEPAWPAHELAKQKAHITADLRSRLDTIFNLAFDHFRSKLFAGHPYSRPADGTEKTVNAFTRKDLGRWHARYVRPEQTILSFIGPWSVREARQHVEKTLGHWKKSQPSIAAKLIPIHTQAQRPAPTRGGEAVLRAPFQQAYFMTGTHAPAILDRQVLPLKLFNIVLGGGMSSRLFMELREKMGLAYEVSSFYPTRLDGSAWAAYLGLPVERLEAAEKALAQLLVHTAEQGPSSAEVEQAKKMMLGSYIMDQQTRRRQAWYAGWWEFLGRDLDYGSHYIARIKAITRQEVHAAGRELLLQPRLVVKVIPK